MFTHRLPRDHSDRGSGPQCRNRKKEHRRDHFPNEQPREPTRLPKERYRGAGNEHEKREIHYPFANECDREFLQLRSVDTIVIMQGTRDEFERSYHLADGEKDQPPANPLRFLDRAPFHSINWQLVLRLGPLSGWGYLDARRSGGPFS